MSISVIVSTYNQPDWLRLCLLGYSRQQGPEFEIVIADDGSDDRTREVVHWARNELGLSIQHVWHEDDGFRKCAILNKAVVAAKGEYLIFTDGDCIPKHDFVAVHDSLKREKAFLSGGYIKLPQKVSDAIDDKHVVSGEFCQRSWLVSQGFPRFENLSKLTAKGRIATLLNQFSRTRAGWHGHNASCWKSDALAINGFDERMGWGGEDREYGYRLVNKGIDGIRIRYSAICVHLSHDRPWRDDKILEANDEIRLETHRTGRTVTDYGITQSVLNGVERQSAVR